MEKQHIIIGIVIFLVVVAGLFFYTSIQKSNIGKETEPPQNDETPVAGPYDSIVSVDAKHFFSDGTHTLVGEILLPTPCDLLNWDVLIAESYPEQVTVNFNVINNAETCAQVVTAQRFKVSFEAHQDATIMARFMGRPVRLNLIPGGEGESPDSFELFIKG